MTRVAIFGAGGMGGTHARHYSRIEGVELAIFDPATDRAEALADRHCATVSSSAAEAIEWADLVDVCTPTDSHAELAHQAIAAGRAVLVEKPLACDLAEAAEIVRHADRVGVPLMVGQVVRYFPEFRRGHDLVAEGRVGKPAAARMRRGGGPPKAPWFMDHKRSGGVLIDLAVHDFDWLRWTLGEVDHLYARSVGAASGQGPDYALTTLTFDSGCVAHVESTWMDPSGFRVSFEVAGSDGMIEYDSRQTAVLKTHLAGASRGEAPLDGGDDPYYRQLTDVVATVRGEQAPAVNGLDGFAALAIAVAARESAQTGRVIQPVREP